MCAFKYGYYLSTCKAQPDYINVKLNKRNYPICMTKAMKADLKGNRYKY